MSKYHRNAGFTTRSCILALSAALVLYACDDPTGPGADLAKARRQWQAAGLMDYRFTLSHGCDACGPALFGPVVIEVHRGDVTMRQYARTGEPVPANITSSFPNIEGLFGFIIAELEGGAESVSVDYDLLLGYPVRISIDRVRRAVDDEEGYTVTEFTVLTPVR